MLIKGQTSIHRHLFRNNLSPLIQLPNRFLLSLHRRRGPLEGDQVRALRLRVRLQQQHLPPHGHPHPRQRGRQGRRRRGELPHRQGRRRHRLPQDPFNPLRKTWKSECRKEELFIHRAGFLRSFA